MSKNKFRVGIDIDEILRSKWLQFDKYYVEEFGEEGTPKTEPYCFDFFGNYEWNDVVEKVKYLREPNETPETINLLDYQVDENGECLADGVLFDKEEKSKLTAKEVYNRFMFEDYCFEIYGAAPVMYRNVDLVLNQFYKKYSKFIDITISSIENPFSIPHTLFFLSKCVCRVDSYKFVGDASEYWEHFDIMITTNPDVVQTKPEGKTVVLLERPYNKNLEDKGFDLGVEKPLHIADVLDNANFENLIGYIYDNN